MVSTQLDASPKTSTPQYATLLNVCQHHTALRANFENLRTMLNASQSGSMATSQRRKFSSPFITAPSV